MSVEIKGMAEVRALLGRLGRWVSTDSRSDVDKGASDLAKDFREKISRGEGADGSPLAPLKKATLEAPIRREHNNTPRKSYGVAPLNASGKTARSITSKKSGYDEWEISSESEMGDAILASNARATHHGLPFAGDTPKQVRDPLLVTEKQMDIIEDALVEGIDKALNG